MNDEISHLTTGAAALLAETDERRVRAIRSRRWVLYPRAKQALDRLNRLLNHPRGTRMPSVAIYGDSGMGKTMIMKRFRDEHSPSFSPVTGTLRTPVLAMEMTSRPGERRFYAELLTLLGAPQRPRADIAQMEQLTEDQEIRLASMFATEPAVVRRMTLTNVARSSHRLIAARPMQCCTNCNPDHIAPAAEPILRSQLLGWRITCPLCRDMLRDADGPRLPSPFRRYHGAALRGERLLDAEAERGTRT